MIERTDGEGCTWLCNDVQEKECVGLKTLSNVEVRVSV